MMDKKEKISAILGLYLIPALFSVLVPLGELRVNGADVAWYVASAIGFAFGVGVEGVLIVIGLTVAVLLNKV